MTVNFRIKIWLEIVCFDLSVGFALEEKIVTTKVTKFLSTLRVEITWFGKYFMKNGIIKCYSALNSGQLSVTSVFLP